MLGGAAAAGVEMRAWRLAPERAVIGFCGGPFTVAGYLVEGRPSRDFVKTKGLMYAAPEVWHALMEKLTETFVLYLRAKQAAGAIKGDNPDQDAGIKIVLRALEEPIRQIAANAGDEPSVVVAKVLEAKGNVGYNAATGEYGDLVEMGVLDPTKVTRYALQNAASVAALTLTTDAMVAESPKLQLRYVAVECPPWRAMPRPLDGCGRAGPQPLFVYFRTSGRPQDRKSAVR